MVNFKTLSVLTLTEARLTLKLRRTQIILLVAGLLCASFYVLVELQYVFRAAESASVGIMAPTYIAATLGPYFVALFCITIVLLAYDIRERDLRCRIIEVLEVVPASNVIVVMGRLLGLVLLLVVPIVLFVISIVLYGWIAEGFGLGYGNLIELHSVASLLIWDLVPNLTFFGSSALFLATIIRSRGTVLLLSLSGIFIVFWLFLRLPFDVSGTLVTTTGATLFPSEIAPRFVSTDVIVNRCSLSLFTAGFVVLAGSFWRRPLTNREYFTTVGISCWVLGALIIGGSIVHQELRQHEVQSWVRAHDALELSTFPDITHISGNVAIVPGRRVDLDLILDLLLPENNASDFVVLSLNPGYRISTLWVGEKEVNDHRFEHGILEIPISIQEGNSVSVRVMADGRPDARFAYLDAAIQTKDIAGAKVRNLFALGTKSFIFHPRYVVLTSGIKWYPTAGAATGEDEWEVRPRDLYMLDLEVSVPKNWLVAGPGHSELKSADEKHKSTYRIAPKNPVPEFTLVSSNFERASTEVEGVEFEVLYARQHSRRFKDLSELRESLELRLLSLLYWYKGVGLVYPYERFSVVEVPSTLRVFGGGWKMDTVMGPPGMILMRESSLPNTKISIGHEIYHWINVSRNESSDLYRLSSTNYGTLLSSYFNSNVFGEHPSIGFARNFFGYQTSTTGQSARILDHVMEEAVQRLIFDRSVYAKDRIGISPGRSFVFDVALANAKRHVFDLFDLSQSTQTKSREELTLLKDSKQSGTWNDLELYSLGELAFDQAPFRSYRVIRLKSAALSRIILDLLGRSLMAELCANLAKTYRGKSYTYADVLNAAQDIDLDLDDTLGDWLDAKGLPGFILAEPTITRLPNDGSAKVFQASLVVHNAEPFDGFATVSWLNERTYGGQRDDTRNEATPFLVRGEESVRLSVISDWLPKPIDIVYIEPFLSLNREAIRIDIPNLIDVDKIEETKQPYLVDFVWTPVDIQEIVVDDLDSGFEIVYDSPPRTTIPAISFVRDLLGTSNVEEWDRGLPVYLFESDSLLPKQRWMRRSDPRAFGKYRHTYAFVHHGRLERPSFAKFVATLPNTGSWRLDYFMPVEALGPNDREAHILLAQGKRIDWYDKFKPGTAKINVLIGEESETFEFNAQNADFGWNSLGVFDVDSTNTEVWISGASDRQTIYADAIRWVPLDEP